jgi:hypothetical protein
MLGRVDQGFVDINRHEVMREMDLTVEKKVQESLAAVHAKAKQEAEEGLKLRVAESREAVHGTPPSLTPIRISTPILTMS